MKKILALALTAALAFSLAACGGGGGAASSSPSQSGGSSTGSASGTGSEGSSEASPEVDSIDLETEAGHLVYTSYEFAGEDFYGEHIDGDPSKTIILNFDFTNKESKPAQAQEQFRFSIYQNGTELEWPSSWSTAPASMENYFNTSMKDSTVTIGVPCVLQDYSPLTVMVEDHSNDDNYQMMEIEISTDGIATNEAGQGDGSEQSGGEPEAPAGIWSVNYYVDDFQQPTDEWYITTSSTFSGTFSNSATTNSKLEVQVLADAEDIAFFLYEYGRSQVKNSSSNYVDEYDITMRTADGTDHSLSGTVYCGGDRLMIEGKDMDTVLAAMKDGGTISFHIVESDRTTTSYLFSLEASNFSQVYEEMAG